MASASDFLVSQSIQPCELTSVTPPREPSGVDGYRARTGPRSPESGPGCLPLDWLLPAMWYRHSCYVSGESLRSSDVR